MPKKKSLAKDSPAAASLLNRDYALLQEEMDFTRWLSKDIAVLDYFAGIPEKVPKELWIPLEALRIKKGRKFYAELLYALTHQTFSPDEAVVLWDTIVMHKKMLVKKIGRDIGMKVAVLDYLDHQSGEDLQLLPGADLENLLYFANEDGLTSLYNHRYFQERLNYEIQRSARYHHPLSLFFIDIDHFKKYNDAFGHMQGDALIREIAVFLKTNCRQTDIVARYGGDEFAVILPETSSRQALLAARRLQEKFKKIRNKFAAASKRFPMGLSLGIALFPSSGRSGDHLVEAADQALYRAKRAGRNCICAGKKIHRLA